MDPREWRQSVQKRLNDHLDRARSLITALDLMEADCDLEDGADAEPSIGEDDREQDNSDHEDGGDDEPMMGAIELRTGSQEDWAGDRPRLPGHDECEAENEHGGDINDEAQGGQLGETWEDSEASLGWTNHIDQRLNMNVDDTAWIEDGEFDAGDAPEPPEDGETVMWPDDLIDQTVLVSL